MTILESRTVRFLDAPELPYLLKIHLPSEGQSASLWVQITPLFDPFERKVKDSFVVWSEESAWKWGLQRIEENVLALLDAREPGFIIPGGEYQGWRIDQVPDDYLIPTLWRNSRDCLEWQAADHERRRRIARDQAAHASLFEEVHHAAA